MTDDSFWLNEVNSYSALLTIVRIYKLYLLTYYMVTKQQLITYNIEHRKTTAIF